MAAQPLPARVPPAPAVSATEELTLAGAGEAAGADQATSASFRAVPGTPGVGVVAAAGRSSRCLVLMPATLDPEEAELLRACREGVVAWSGAVPHFTAGLEGADTGPARRLHVLGDDPQRSVYAPGIDGRASLCEDFWPATFDDLCRAGSAARPASVGSAGRPQASRPVWAALGAGVPVEPGDVVVVVLAEGVQRPPLDRRAPDRPPVASWARTALRGAAGAIVAAATLLLGVLTAVAVTPSLLGKNDRRPSVVAPPAGGGTDAARTEAAPGARFDAYAARVRGNDVTVYERPADDATQVRSFPGVGDYDARQTFLVQREHRQPDGVWYEVLLPVRPNGTTGWVRAGDIEVVGLPYRIEVRLGSLELLLFHDGQLERTFPIGIGTVHTPTPPGRYSIKYLMRPDDQNTLYGHYVYGLSGFSDAVRDAPGGGELGIHGTNDPGSSIGRRVSQGCIRLRNEDIESLVPLLPLGTPVDVVDDRPRS